MQTGGFKRGVQSGLWKRYQENGELYDAGKFVDGKKTGEWKYYDNAGKLTRTKTFLHAICIIRRGPRHLPTTDPTSSLPSPHAAALPARAARA